MSVITGDHFAGLAAKLRDEPYEPLAKRELSRFNRENADFLNYA
jgi:hypothetical protein